MLFVGKLEPYNNVRMLINLARKLKDSNVRLVCIGEGSQEKDLIDYAQKKGDLTSFYAHLDDDKFIRYFQGCAFYVSAGHDTSGVLQAQACGVPVLVPDVGDNIDFAVMDNDALKGCTINEGVLKKGSIGHSTGLRYHYGDAKDLLFGAEFLWKNRDQRVEMGRNARNRVEEFTLEKTIGAYEHLFEMARKRTK